ncbi:MAG: DUF2961 domain-containing protein [Candidatus Hydrogenedentes bacterium]|nr:DUF2961 domain-containing protein [Candidatus Hydrogenedentota bacterium]
MLCTALTVFVALPLFSQSLHFAMPQTLELGRDVALRIYWDGEEAPSVDCPLVDFFGDPAGQFEQVNTAVVNKRRGFNTYFPMPFGTSAKVVVAYEGPLPAGPELMSKMPCYSYVMYRKTKALPPELGYFHACWRQQGLYLGDEPYVALEATGKGKFVGWGVTMRTPGRKAYPVDMNEDFFIDGEQTPAVSMQGIEDSFGFSWGFPPSENVFPLTGYREFLDGAAAYRFFINDAITFEKSLRVLIQFGKEETWFKKAFGKSGSMLELSSTVYWYQTEPHAPLPALPPVAQRAPAPTDNPLWPGKEELPTPEELQSRGVTFHMRCGRPEKDMLFAAEGYALPEHNGQVYTGFAPPIYYCLYQEKELTLRLQVPKGVSGTLRLYCIDSDNFMGGRRQAIFLDNTEISRLDESFEDGVWIEAPVTPEMSADGEFEIMIKNLRDKANVVLSMVEMVAAPAQSARLFRGS